VPAEICANYTSPVANEKERKRMMITTPTHKTFDVFQHPSKGYQAVDHGFSWPAFVFTIFWGFLNRLWLEAFLMAIIVGILVCVPAFAVVMHGAFGDGGLGFAVSLIFGFKGNEWRKRQMVEHGWKLVASIQADSPARAIAEARQRAGVWTEADARESLAAAHRLEVSGNVAAAIESYDQIIQRFPGSEAARDAEASIRSLKQR
jgi:hypothetical protein